MIFCNVLIVQRVILTFSSFPSDFFLFFCFWYFMLQLLCFWVSSGRFHMVVPPFGKGKPKMNYAERLKISEGIAQVLDLWMQKAKNEELPTESVL